MGSLAVCQHSHKRDSALFDLLHATYGQTFVGQNGTSDGWLTDDGSLVKQSIEQWQTDKTPKMDQETSIQWLTTNFKAGLKIGLKYLKSPFLFKRRRFGS